MMLTWYHKYIIYILLKFKIYKLLKTLIIFIFFFDIIQLNYDKNKYKCIDILNFIK